MSSTIVNLGTLPQYRGDYDDIPVADRKFYKDNIVTYNGSAFVVDIPFNPQTPSYVDTAPYDVDMEHLNTGWKIFCTGNGTFSTGENVYETGIDNVPTVSSNALVTSGGVTTYTAVNGNAYDISAAHSGTTYADLTAALGTDGENVPLSLRKGGMSVKFISTSDNKYVQYFLTKDEWSTSEYDWLKTSDNIKDEVTGITGIDVNISSLQDDVFDDSGTWKGNNISNYCGSFISCLGFGKLYIKANDSYSAAISFIREIGESGTTVNYSEGYTRISITQGIDAEINIPNDAKYIWVGKKGSGNNIAPQSVKIIGVLSSLNGDVNTIDEDIYNKENIEWNIGLVNDNGLLKTSTKDKVSNPILLRKGEKITVATKTDGGYYFSCIASVPSAETSISIGTTSTSLVNIIGADIKYYSYTATEDAYVIICVNKEVYNDIIIKRNKSLNLFNENEIDLSQYQNGAWNDADTWKVNNLTNYCGLFIPVAQGQTYILKGSINKSSYSLVKSIGISSTPVQYATNDETVGSGYNINGIVSLLPNQISKIQIPKDAKFLWISKIGGGVDKLPQPITYSPTQPEVFNSLFGKKLAVDGDSICYGAGWLGGYAKMIGQRNCMRVQNLGVGGGTIAAGTQNGNTNRHWICRSVANLNDDADYVLIEGGVNDALLNVPLGSITPAINSTIDDETFYGAFESMLRTIMVKFQGKKYGYIFVHQAQGGLNPGTDYYNAAMACLTKYGVPYLDLSKMVAPFGVSGFDTDMVNKYTNNHPTQQGIGDGLHPSQEGYDKYYVPKIEAWMKTL